ncbi:MAG TPA: carboxymuconolactone decarboxylase family protein [Myxococcota bacterium]|nr:carboxymuconolactone decarboxylase family protein [Myxococcota bacterium]
MNGLADIAASMPAAVSAAQRWGIAVASAIASRNQPFRDAILAEASREVDAAVIDDAEAAAALMSMTNIYYRFRHLIGKPGYSEKQARLRMNRLAKATTSKTDLELFCLTVSAINGCEVCLRAHEKAVLDGGLSEDQVHDAVRIAAVVHAAAVALEIPMAPSKVAQAAVA